MHVAAEIIIKMANKSAFLAVCIILCITFAKVTIAQSGTGRQSTLPNNNPTPTTPDPKNTTVSTKEGRKTQPKCHESNLSIHFKVLLCSGTNCDLPYLKERERRGEFRIVRWKETTAETQKLGPQLSLSDRQASAIFGKKADKLIAFDLEERFQDVTYTVTGNPEQAQYFDLDHPQKGHFKWATGGNFFFINNAEKEMNHHITVAITLTFRKKCS